MTCRGRVCWVWNPDDARNLTLTPSRAGRGTRYGRRRSATLGLRFDSRAVILNATWRLRMSTSTDRIEKSVLLRAPQERVWRAISDSKQFGSWFGVEFEEPFVAGKSIVGKMVPTSVDAEVAKRQEPYRGYRFEFAVD